MVKMPRLFAAFTIGCLALLLPVQAAPVSSSYLISATDFDDGGTLTGTISGTLTEWLAAPSPPFAAGTGRMTLPELNGFSATFSGSSVLPASSFDLSELISVTLVDDGTFGARGGQPGSAPALFELVAYDDESDSDLFIRFAALPGAIPLLSGDFGAGIEWRADDISARLSDQVSVQLQGDPRQVPVAPTLTLVLLALALMRTSHRWSAAQSDANGVQVFVQDGCAHGGQGFRA